MTTQHGAPGGMHRSAGSLGTVKSVEDRPGAGSVTGSERDATVPIRSERSCHQRSVVQAMHRPRVPQQPHLAKQVFPSRGESPMTEFAGINRAQAAGRWSWTSRSQTPPGGRAGVVGGRPFAAGDRVAGRGTRSRTRVESGRGRGGRLPRNWRELEGGRSLRRTRREPTAEQTLRRAKKPPGCCQPGGLTQTVLRSDLPSSRN